MHVFHSWMFSRLAVFLGATVSLSCIDMTCLAGMPPVEIRDAYREDARLRLPSGELALIYLDENDMGGMVLSTDGGKSWSEPKTPVRRWASATFLDHDGQLHGFFMLFRQVREGREISVDQFVDVWHVRTVGPDKVWEKGKIIQAGWNGSINGGPVQLDSGRIVMPSQNIGPGGSYESPTGLGYSLALYSDDGGATWAWSNPITAPVIPDYNGANIGASEPTLIQLLDGHLWMLMRSQMGCLYESYSDDGANWSPGEPTDFYSSTSPASLLRMSQDRLLLFWNNCEMPPRVKGAEIYGGRDVLHAAISLDDGKTWRGFREIMLDPRRHEPPPRNGDRGTGYPFAILSEDGRFAEVTAGQGDHRVVLRVDPDWLLEKEYADDFSEGFAHWTAFKSFGPVQRYWRDRVIGPEFIADPTGTGGRVMLLRKEDDKDADGACWNFPAGTGGELSVQVMFRRGSGGGWIALNDRFFEPTDPNAIDMGIYGLMVEPSGHLAGSEYTFPMDQWASMKLAWDGISKTCAVLVNGERVAMLPQLHESAYGPSYLYLLSTAHDVDQAGFLVGPIAVHVD